MGYLKATLALIRISTPVLRIRWLLACWFIFAFPHNPAMAAEAAQNDTLPSFAELEAAGAMIGSISVDTQDIFDLEDPEENKLLYRLANKLHIKTRPHVIEGLLLFKSGDPVSARQIEESERALRRNSFLYDIAIKPVAYHDGIVDIEVETRDTWSLQPGFRYSRAGGTNSSGITFEEVNLLGTGTSFGVWSVSDVDRNGTELAISDQHAFGGWYDTNYRYARLSDGKRQSFSLAQPFYALDTRWSAGASVSLDDRIEPLYNSGILVGQYAHSQKRGEVFGGWSSGLIEGWVRRYSAGLTYEANTYGLDATRFPPVQPPPDERVTAPFFRYEVIEDNYQKFKNRDLIERPEYVAMGLQSSVQIGNALNSLGSSNNLWLYSGSISNGFEIASSNDLLVTASVSGKYWPKASNRRLLKGSVRYYKPQSTHTLFFISLEGAAVTDPGIDEQLMLGGDNGLRGYPLRYQSGNRRALLTMEKRAYADWYPLRLFRIGGAVFYDVGRAWGSDMNQNVLNPGWLHDVGFGLRILSARSAFGHVIHADFAFPLDRDSGTKSFQFLVKTQTSF